MHVYFFDVVTPNYVQHDFHGRKLNVPDDAIQLAELIALDIECSTQDWIDMQVVVRDAEGSRLHAVNVRRPDMIVH